MSGSVLERRPRSLDCKREDGLPSETACRCRAMVDAVWSPIPWMLEGVGMVLLTLGDYAGMTTVVILLGVNVVCGLVWDGPMRPHNVATHSASRPSLFLDRPRATFAAFELQPAPARITPRSQAATRARVLST